MHTFQIGCARTDITPPIGMPYLGLVPRHPPIKGVADPLIARAAYISTGDDSIIIVSADTIGFASTILGKGRSLVGEIKESIESETGISSSNILIASNHIHSSAETLGFRPLSAEYPHAIGWLEDMQRSMAKCAVTACHSTVNATLKITKGSVPGIAVNRRKDDCIDDEVTVLMFESENGPELVMVNYACHPVILQVQDLVSADYVGAMVSAVEEEINDLKSCMFLLGACGDIDPAVGNTKRLNDACNMGKTLAAEVVRLISSMRRPEYIEEMAIVKAASEEITFPSRPLPAEDEIDRWALLAKAIQAEINSLPESEAKKERAAELRLIEEKLIRAEEGHGPFTGEVQVLRIGGAIITAMPGEIFCSTGKAVKSLSLPFTGIPVSCSNAYLGYMAPPEAWDKGGYETALGPWSKVGPEAPKILLDAIKELAKQVK